MKLIDYVKQSLHQFPTLYLYPDFESSYIRILDHTFGTLGNGLDWANTRNPRKGGYLCEKEFKKYNGEFVRKYNKNYGVEIYDFDMEEFFKNQVVCVYEMNTMKDKFVGTLQEYESHEKNSYWEANLFRVEDDWKISDMFSINYNVCLTNSRKTSNREKDFAFYNWSPYPYFKKQYSCFWQDGSEYIQEDWKVGALYYLNECEKFFRDEERVKLFCYYPKPKELEKHILEDIEAGKYGSENINEEVNKIYETTCFSGDNFEEMAQERWDKELKNNLEFIEETRFKLLR